MDKTLLRIFYLPIMMVILITIWIFTYYMPIQNQSKKLIKHMHVLNSKVQHEVPEIKVTLMQITVDSLKSRLHNSMHKLFPESELLSLGKLLESTIQGYELKVVALSPDYKILADIASDNSEISKMPLTIELQGGFMQMTKFMDALPDLPFVYQLNGFKILKENDDGTKLNIELNGVLLLRKNKNVKQSKLVMKEKNQASS